MDFARALVAGLEARLLGAPPEAMARVEIWVNTERARRALVAALTQGPARLLPRVRAVSDLANDPLAPLDLGPPVPTLRRKLELARLVTRLIAAEAGIASETAAFDLADSLGDLMDEMQGEGVDPAVIAGIDAAEHAAHWQRSLRFLEILRDYVAAGGMSEGQGRMRAVAEAWADAWTQTPPTHPVIVAGSTGSRGATRRFMAAVARLPQGALVLPGYDFDLTPAAWRRLGADDAGAADHPQHGFRRLADALGFDPACVPRWRPEPPPAPERNALVSLALRPAPVTDQWRGEGRKLTATLGAAVAGLAWIEAPDQRSEARAVALALRGAVETGTRAALVTPDRTLARRVTAELDRWGLIPDDSAGRPLALTPPGVLLRGVAAVVGAPITPEALLALLKHPLTSSTPDGRRSHLDLTAGLELRLLRGGPPHVDWDAVSGWAAERGGAAPAWASWLRAALDPLLAGGTTDLAAAVARHRGAVEALAAGPDGVAQSGLWDKAAGRQALGVFEGLAAEAGAFGDIRPSEYRALLQSLLAASDVREEAVVTHADVAIWGTLEARVQSADLVILGGLNEGIWPRLPGPDAWLSRSMRRQIGLLAPERQIGLSAHDFQQAMGARRVILSRATRDADAPTVASRWLMRLENLLRGLGAEGCAAHASARAQGETWLAQSVPLDLPAARVLQSRRPAPAPPLAARPVSLSVTRIETLVRDPYQIYASKVLRLRPLDPPGRKPDALARGSALHAALDAFLAATEADSTGDLADILARCVRQTLTAAAPWPSVRELWIARLDRAAAWFLQGETERRARARPSAREVGGSRALTGLAAPFSVTAKADRIDRAPDGRYAIYDYKSGGIPTEPEARAFHLQLPLEAAIAAAGGFDGLAAGDAFRLELLGIGPRRSLVLDAAPDAVAETWDRLHTLVRHYQEPSNGFVARLRPQRLTYASDYDHLSRYGEWADGDPPETEIWP